MAAPRTNPPRWFAPALFAGMVLSIAGLVGLGALLYQPTQETLAIGDRNFVIPPAAVVSVTREPHLFIRIRPRDQPFYIVYDERAAGRRDRTGVPHIFAVNDHGHHDVWYARDERSIVICRRASNPTGGCGTWMSYGGATWSILFPESRIGEADRFVGQATTLLKKYDTSVRSLLP